MLLKTLSGSRDFKKGEREGERERERERESIYRPSSTLGFVLEVLQKRLFTKILNKGGTLKGTSTTSREAEAYEEGAPSAAKMNVQITNPCAKNGVSAKSP